MSLQDKSFTLLICRRSQSTLGQDQIVKQGHTLIEIFWSDLTCKQQKSQIYRSAGTPVLHLSRPEYTECLRAVNLGTLLLKCLIRPKNFYQCGLLPGLTVQKSSAWCNTHMAHKSVKISSAKQTIGAKS